MPPTGAAAVDGAIEIAAPSGVPMATARPTIPTRRLSDRGDEEDEAIRIPTSFHHRATNGGSGRPCAQIAWRRGLLRH